MRQFEYPQVIPRDPYVPVSPDMIRKDIDVMYDDFHNHLVPDEAHSVVASHHWCIQLHPMVFQNVTSLHDTRYSRRSTYVSSSGDIKGGAG